MQILLSAIYPVFSLIFIGYIFKIYKFPGGDFWNLADKFTYYALFPSLLIYKLSIANFGSIEILPIFKTLFSIFLLMTFLLIVLQKILKVKPDSFTSIYQGSIRFNTYIFLSLSIYFFDDFGLVLSAIIISLAIPLINFLCITIFAFYIRDDKFSIKNTAFTIIKNPLIIGCFIGIGINILDLKFIFIIEPILKIFSQMALPLGLLSIGFGLNFGDFFIKKSYIILASLFKLILFPILMYYFALFFEIDKKAIFVLLLFATLPTAPASYILAKELKGDIGLISSIITFETVISILSISFFLSIFKM